MLATGEPAPDFSLPSDDGATVALSDLSLRGPVVIFFYPKDSTPGCTVEAGAFAANYEAIAAEGASVVGVSSDDGASHASFKAACGLPFALLSDRGGAVRARYGVPKTLGLLPGRTTFVIGADGLVKHVTNAPFAPKRHPEEALAALRTLRMGQPA